MLLFKPPKGGLPGIDSSRKVAFAARVPIHGTRDAGRQFYKQISKSAVAAGLDECRSLKSFYFAEGGEVKVMLAAHVDDLMWVCADGYEACVDSIL